VLKTSEPTKEPQKEIAQPQTTKAKPNLEAADAKTSKAETKTGEGKNDAVMRDVLDSWGAEGNFYKVKEY